MLWQVLYKRIAFLFCHDYKLYRDDAWTFPCLQWLFHLGNAIQYILIYTAVIWQCMQWIILYNNNHIVLFSIISNVYWRMPLGIKWHDYQGLISITVWKCYSCLQRRILNDEVQISGTVHVLHTNKWNQTTPQGSCKQDVGWTVIDQSGRAHGTLINSWFPLTSMT